MTMSVGLARIVNDPSASVLVRKALGALSTPGLLVYDTSLTIDDTGRLALRLKEGGGLIQDEDGLYTEITVGVDSHVDLVSEEYDRDWNAYLTGTAPNYMESGLAIGAKTFSSSTAAAVAANIPIQDAQVNITGTTTQLRLSYNQSSFCSQRVLPTGIVELYCTGSSPGLNIFTGNGSQPDGGASSFSGGVSINGGITIEQIFAFKASTSWAGGGAAGVASWVDFTFTLTGAYTVRPGQDHVTAVPSDGTAIPAWWLGWSARVSATNEITIRVSYWDVTLAADNRDWIIVVHKFPA